MAFTLTLTVLAKKLTLLHLTLPVPSILESCIKNNRTYLWCLKRFYEDLKGPHKTF